MTGQAPTWMFEPVATMGPQHWQRWMQRCHVISEVDELLRDPVRSIVLSTFPGCGLTTSLNLLQSRDLLVFPYNPSQWPGEPHAFTKAESHFEQWMAKIAYSLSEELGEHPAWCERLNQYQLQFLTWLVERYLGRRPSLVWHDFLRVQLPGAAWEDLKGLIEREPIEYGGSVADLKYQIHECLGVARALGRRGIFASIDLSWWDWVGRSLAERDRLDGQLKRLLTTLAPLEVPHFGVKLGVPEQLLQPQEIDRLTRSRVKPTIYPTTYRWSLEQLHGLCVALVQLSADEWGVDLQSPPRELLGMLGTDVEAIWGAYGPAAAMTLARVWVKQWSGELPGAGQLQAVRSGLYRYGAPLRRMPLDGSQTVLRGRQPIHLDDMPFRIFQVLWRHKGSPANNEALLQVAGTKANLDKLIQRLREQLEPPARGGEFIYIQRRQNGGTWLEKDACIFTDHS